MTKKETTTLKLRLKHWETKRRECRAQENLNGAKACTEVIEDIKARLKR